MTKDKLKADKTRLAVCILAGLTLGSFLGSPVPDLWAGHITRTVSALSEQRAETATLHNKTEKAAAVKDEADADKIIPAAADKEAGISQTSASGIEIIVSQPLAEVQPDFISYNVNRSGTADRKEKDVLIRLINAEAYGLSYKAKLAVGQVVMNRWKGPHYGDDLLAIMTAPYQFTPIFDGSAYEKEIEPDSIEAANAVLTGTGVKELTEDTYYFVNPDFTEDKTIETEMQFVCEIDGIHFFKPPAK